jgi:transcriptional regulator NrdR family protein
VAEGKCALVKCGSNGQRNSLEKEIVSSRIIRSRVQDEQRRAGRRRIVVPCDSRLELLELVGLLEHIMDTEKQQIEQAG